MDITGVLVLILVILLLYVLVKYVMQGSQVQTGIETALKMQTIKAVSITSGSVSAANFSHCIWFYVEDWNYNYGTYKPLLVRTSSVPASTGVVPGLMFKDLCPAVVLGAQNNDLQIFQSLFDDGSSTRSANTVVADGTKYNRCHLTNIPIQKWCYLIISYYGRTCDVYLDGKLIKTCVMDGTAKVDKDANLYITSPIDASKGSFKGWTSNYQFFPGAINPQQAYDLYKKGFGGNWLTSLLNMQVTVSISKNGKVQQEYSF